MANQYGKINLLSLYGAYVTHDANGRNVVVVPCDLNDIELYQSQTTGGIIDASLKINLNEMSDATRQAKVAKSSKDGFVPPTHWIKLGVRKEVFESRIQNAATKVIAKKPDLAAYNPMQSKLANGDYNPLYSEINNVLHPILGEVFTVGGAPVAFSGQAPVAPQAPAFQKTEEELPF